ncbi:lipocalin family protein [Winogradskyella sp.]|uniref:lipocalin family protein n=1 Tax=Winogradskyella sp. TaxID=1883156 RepID=UPI00262DB728|nr:lipocalin family protein [Winogradskyella sp.]
MKNLKIIFFGITLILLSSCSNNDDSDEETPDTSNYAELILGDWRPTSVLIDGEEEEGPCVLDWRFSYNNDGTYGSGPGDMGICGGIGGTGLYEVSGNKVFLNSAMGDIDFEYTIQTLNENTFIYEERILEEGFPDLRLFTCEKIVD